MAESTDVIVAALEKACKKINELTERIDKIEKQMIVMEHRLGEAEMVAGANAEVNHWMVQTSKEPAYEVPLTNRSLQQLTTNYHDKRNGI